MGVLNATIFGFYPDCTAYLTAKRKCVVLSVAKLQARLSGEVRARNTEDGLLAALKCGVYDLF